MAGPKRSDAWKARSKVISLSIIPRCACSVWAVNLTGLKDPPLQAGLKPGPYKVKIRWHLMIDELGLRGVYSAELLSLPVSTPASPRRR